jgi:hypothetical protein
MYDILVSSGYNNNCGDGELYKNAMYLSTIGSRRNISQGQSICSGCGPEPYPYCENDKNSKPTRTAQRLFRKRWLQRIIIRFSKMC